MRLNYYYFYKYLFIYLFGCAGSQLRHAGSFSCGMWDHYLQHANSQLQHVRSSSLTRNRTQTPCIGSTEYLFIYLFIYLNFGCVGSSLQCPGFVLVAARDATLRCGVRASHCDGFSCCRARALGTLASVVVARGLQSAGSVAVAHGLSCSTACGIFPDQDSNPCPLHWQVDS